MPKVLSKLIINRYHSNDDGTLGICSFYDINGKLLGYFSSLELPYRNNEKNKSCIPTGKYLATKSFHQRLGNVFNIHHVEGRSGILIHSGNTIADTSGCILLGRHANFLVPVNNLMSLHVYDSRASLLLLTSIIENGLFVEIRNGFI
jgi:hypothetical protein